ncbi:hypothetical protein L3556_02960 [Candidatus Synechococcus calcipolaris G9]|uniref:Double-GTPase 2 domain-containing protein n=1 Tax=Candidatus Synechococcus calcipolaris G9 TaxID=1497997 RepID=A0ABT6EXS8_9SYNE|nr:hypothetical protein [Candidatus Synechococcus calcipolaris]MDG2989898.1 hypothetical protein [Candidatus Synechococcus calcipolaris G9]
MHELKITMLGASGVGKTTLLTSMYEQFINSVINQGIELDLQPDILTSRILQDKLIELKNLTSQFSVKGGIQGTEDDKIYKFRVGRKGEKPSLELKFCDYPGRYHTSENFDHHQFILKQLVDCVAVLLAIDSPALMERDGHWHDQFNRPQQIRDLFAEAYAGLDSPRLIIMAPVRCEKYMQTERSARDFVYRIKEKYSPLLNLFSSNSIDSNLAVVILPVQTVGGVIFSRIEMYDEFPVFKFRKASPSSEYAPKDSDQPLRYLMRFLLMLHLSQRKWKIPNEGISDNINDYIRTLFNIDFNINQIIDGIRQVFKSDSHLTSAIDHYSQGCKSSGAFEIIQGHHLLDRY